MVKNIIKKVFGDPQAKTVKRLTKRGDEIDALAESYKGKSVAELKEQLAGYRKDLAEDKVKLDDIMDDVFAAVREATTQVLGMTHFKVQLVGGVVLHEGSVAEMRTGEGKTLVATLPVVLNGLAGKGVHVVTVNDYLAQRDAGWMGLIYDALGLSVAVIIAEKTFIYDAEYENNEHDDERLRHLKPCSRQEGYNADITYGTNNEFGFDYLRDNMVNDVNDLRQRPLSYAIVDEVDSILIDEARTPLIISAPATSSGSAYSTFANIAKKLQPEDYILDEKRRSVALTDDGVVKVQKILGIDNLYGPDNVRNIYHLDQSLRAQTLFNRDKDYVVNEDGEVIIVDEFTGRLMHGRRYNEGLHQAIEAKEGVEVLQESMTLATISFQNYFRLYDKLAGMTGTAITESEEFYEIYKLDVVPIPTNMPVMREDKIDRIYRTEKGKFTALVKEVKQFQDEGRAVLIGTASIEKNEVLSRLLTKSGIKHEVLNAKAHEREAAIVTKAGLPGAVTLATNIAGRGTDIVLEDSVRDKGGLIVLGSERHEARRIDNQLRGRCGRQGDPGLTQFFVSAEDELMRIFGGERVSSLMNRMGVDEETPIQNRAVSKALENAQKKVESSNFDSRKHVVQYDDVMNRQRKSVYAERQAALRKDDISDHIKDFIREEIGSLAPQEDDKLSKLVDEANTTFPFDDDTVKKLKNVKNEEFVAKAEASALELHKDRERTFTPQLMRKIEREVNLQVLDTLWMQHLENMGHLREGINWRSIGQRDPLVEYRREGQKMYEQMQDSVRNETLKTLFRAVPHVHDEEGNHVETELTKAAEQAQRIDAKQVLVTQKQEAKAEKKPVVTTSTVEPADSREENKKRREQRKKKKAKRKKGRR